MSSNLKKWKITEKIHIKNIGEVPIFDITKDGAELIVSNDKNLAVFRILDSEDHAMYNNSESSVECMVTFYNESTPLHVPIYSSYLMKGIDILQINKKRVVYQGYNHPNEPLYLRPPPPKDAYVIGGHGEEKDGYFIVPRDSIIVAKVQSGQFATLLDYNRYLQNLSRMNKDVLCNPLENINQIIDAFGSVAIFEPGDHCPNFYYSLLMCHRSIKACNPSESGIIPVDEIITHPERYADESHMSYENKKTIEDKKDFLMQLYHASVWPMQHIIRQILDQQPSDSTMEQLITLIDNTYRVYQSDLSKSNPGVYYMFVCRYRYALTNSMENFKIKSNANTILGSPESLKKLFYNRIHNTQFRKGHLQNYYTSKTYKNKKSSSIQHNIMEEKNKLHNNSIKLKQLYTDMAPNNNKTLSQIRMLEKSMKTRIKYISSLRKLKENNIKKEEPSNYWTSKEEPSNYWTSKEEPSNYFTGMEQRINNDASENRIRLYEASPEFQSRSTSHYFPNPNATVLRPMLSRKAVVKQGRYRPSPTEQHQREMLHANIEENALREKAHQNAIKASHRRHMMEKERQKVEGGKRRTRKRSKPTRRHST